MIAQLTGWWRKDFPNSTHWMTFDNLLNSFWASVIVELLEAGLSDRCGMFSITTFM